MENDLTKALRRGSLARARDLTSRSVSEWEWEATGLCPEAQADGVPCHEAGRSCDVCIQATATGEVRNSRSKTSHSTARLWSASARSRPISS